MVARPLVPGFRGAEARGWMGAWERRGWRGSMVRWAHGSEGSEGCDGAYYFLPQGPRARKGWTVATLIDRYEDRSPALESWSYDQWSSVFVKCITPDCDRAPLPDCDRCRQCNAASWNLPVDDES